MTTRRAGVAQKTHALNGMVTATRENPIEEYKTLSRRQLIDRLNFLNFQDRDLLAIFRHGQYPHSHSISAFPEPVFDDTLCLRWDQSQDLPKKLDNYHFNHLLLNDGLCLLLVEGTLRRMDMEGLELALPEQAWEIRARRYRRHPCTGISARFLQNSAQFEGLLTDFSPDFLRVRLEATPPQRFFWIDPNAPGYLILSREEQILYSGECYLGRQGHGEETRDFVFRLANRYTQRFRTKEFRSNRQILTPAPEMIFRHPLTGKRVILGIESLSGSGFAVEEEAKEAVLLPGLMLPAVTISFAGTLDIQCQAQVVNRSVASDKEPVIVRHGIALLDMNIADHVKLEALLQQAGDRHSHCLTPVDMDALWSFFFETGFIYPQKYAALRHKKVELKKIYEKLYTEHPDIARHFIYQKNGKILGHMAMLRFYENSWLIHHHAAATKETNRAGIMVLNQIGSFINDSLNLYSIHMQYVMCYYRPENRFPDRIFGGVARQLADAGKCSLDSFAYFHSLPEKESEKPSSPKWKLTPCEEKDIVHLACFYEQESAGLMLRAMDLETASAFAGSIEKEFHRWGFHKERHLLALKKDGVLVAILLLNLSELGLNMSDLTHCLHLFVVNGPALDKNTLFEVIGEMKRKYDQKELPVMIFPRCYADSTGIGYEKIYNLWVMNLRHVDEYFRYLKRFFRGPQSESG